MKKYTHQIGSQIFDIYVGTNSKENWDLIDNSDPIDLWFHVDDFPSGHVVIKEIFDTSQTNPISNEPEYPNQIISLAANYCKSQSKCKDRTKLKIVYTEISNLRKGKNIGSVYVSNPKHIFI